MTGENEKPGISQLTLGKLSMLLEQNLIETDSEGQIGHVFHMHALYLIRP